MIPPEERERILKLLVRLTPETVPIEAERIRLAWHKFKQDVAERWARSPEEIKSDLRSIYITTAFRTYYRERKRRHMNTKTYRVNANRKRRKRYKARSTPERLATEAERKRREYYAKKGITELPPKRKYGSQ